jgi:hypothetical protein
MSEHRDFTELTAWLAGKSEDVWFDCVDRLDWDDGAWVLLWMVGQPQCTRQLAARIFWWSDPTFLAEQLFNGGSLNLNSESDMVVDRILRNWREGLYRKGEIAFEGPDERYQALLREHASRPDPLNVPKGLFGRFDGRMPIVNPNETPDVDPHLWELCDRLGLSVGQRPGSKGYAPPRTPYRTQYEIDRLSAGQRTPESQSTPAPARGLGIFLFVVSLSLLGLIFWFSGFPQKRF